MAAHVPYPTVTRGIYALVHVASGTRYIGRSGLIRKRWLEHTALLRHGHHPNPHLQRAWTRDGMEAFAYTIVEAVPFSVNLKDREQHYLDLLFAERPYRGYNISRSADTPEVGPASIFTRLKQREAKRGKKQSPEAVAARMESIRYRNLVLGPTSRQIAGWARQRGRVLGPPSEATRARISATKTGAPLTKAQQALYAARRGLSQPKWLTAFWAAWQGHPTAAQLAYWERLRGAPPDASHAAANTARRGRALAAEHRANIRAGLQRFYATHAARPRSPETNAKLAEARRGKAWSSARRAAWERQMAEGLTEKQQAHMARMHTPESVAKMAAKLRGRPWTPARRAAYEARQARGHPTPPTPLAPLVQLPLFALPGEGPSA